MKIEDLNCKSCNQNVLVNGLRVVNNNWYCRDCIKTTGGDINSNNSILVFENPTDSTPLKSKTRDYILKEQTLKQ